MAWTTLLLRFTLALAVARAGATPDEGAPVRQLRAVAATNCSGAVPGQAGCERARELGGASQCVASGLQCGYSGNPWCAADSQDKCCCDFGHCAPQLGNAEGIIQMQCYPVDKCISPAEDPSQALCGAGGQQQIPCCGDAVCQPLAGGDGESGGGVLMACVRPPRTATPSTSRSTCVDWNMPCDYYSECCDGYQCTWANTDPEPSTICLSPGADQSGPEGSCAAWNQPCDYYRNCCETYTCTWANTDPEPSTICL